MERAPDDDLESRVDDLERDIEALTDTIARRSPRGPFGLPRPPTPGELLRYADEAAIPAGIAILQANIRLLEALRQAIRLLESGEQARRRGNEISTEAATMRTQVLDQFDAAISELEQAIQGTPRDVPGHDIIADARTLRDDLESRIAETEQGSIDATVEQKEESESIVSEGTTIDIEAELESIKEEQSSDEDEDDSSDDNQSNP